MKKQHHIRTLTSLFLIVGLLLPSVACFSFAAEEKEPVWQYTPKDTVEIQSRELYETLLESSKIFDYIDEEAFKEAKHIERLYTEEAFNTYVFRNADGTETVYCLKDAVKYQNEAGNIVEKDLTLLDSERRFKTASNDIVQILPKSLSDGVSFSSGRGTIRMIPNSALFAGTENEEEAILPNAQADLEENIVCYPGVFGAETKLRYTPTLTGMKEEILLCCYTGKNGFSFLLLTETLSVFEADGRFYLALEEESPERMILGDVWVYDANGSMVRGKMEVEQLAVGSYKVTVRVPEEFLLSADTVYPVTVDPTITVTDENAENAVEDAVLYANLPNTNCGGVMFNDVGSSTYGSAWTAVRFPGLLGTAADGMLHNLIDSVTFHVKEATGNASATVALYPITADSWSENTVTYSQIIGSGNYSGTPITTAALNNSSWTSFNVTSYFSNYEDNTAQKKGFVMHVYGYGNSEPQKQFCSSEYTVSNRQTKPYLTYVYTPYVSIYGEYGACVDVGGEAQMYAATIPRDAPVTWSLSGANDSAYASIDSEGVLTGLAIGTVTVRATVGEGDSQNTADYTVHVVPLLPTEYYIESAKITGKQSFIKPSNHSTLSGAQIITDIFKADSNFGAGIPKGYNENCIWEVYYRITLNSSYYVFRFEENGMYLGWNTQYSMKQNSSGTASTVKFQIENCVGNDGYRRILPSGTLSATKSVQVSTVTDYSSSLILGNQCSDNTDKWIFHRVLPRSGGELMHDLYYNYENTHSDCPACFANCFAYAFNWSLVNYSGGYSFPMTIPGNYSNGYTLDQITWNLQDSEYLYGYTVRQATQYESCNANCTSEKHYKVALTFEDISAGTGFHWYRQGANGLWSAKEGQWGDVTLKDFSNKLIFDPLECDRRVDYGSGSIVYYSNFISYFLITPAVVH